VDRRPAPALQRGDRIRVTRGPLAGFHGLYAGQSSHERVSILLVLLGATASFPAANVAAAR
jgi:transcription antitermination factor NusG